MAKQGSKTGKNRSQTARVLRLITEDEPFDTMDYEDDEPPTPLGPAQDHAEPAREPEPIREQEKEQEEEPPQQSDDLRKRAGESETQDIIRDALEMEFGGGGASARESTEEKAADAEHIPTVRPMTWKRESGTHLNAAFQALEQSEEEFVCFNVTQALVEDKADKYIRMFGMCACARCRIDVIALALSSLPAKYVVAKPHELVPRLSMYEQKYNAAVVTQVMSACKKVLDRPHHSR